MTSIWRLIFYYNGDNSGIGAIFYFTPMASKDLFFLPMNIYKVYNRLTEKIEVKCSAHSANLMMINIDSCISYYIQALSFYILLFNWKCCKIILLLQE